MVKNASRRQIRVVRYEGANRLGTDQEGNHYVSRFNTSGKWGPWRLAALTVR